MSESLRLDVSLEGYRDIDKVTASFQSLLGTMKQAETEQAQLSSAFRTLSNTISKDFVTSVGKLHAAEGRLLTTTKHSNSEEAKRVKLLNNTINTMRELTVMAKEVLRTSDENIKLQVRADNVTARQSNEIAKLTNRYAELTSSQASQIAKLKELNSIKEAELRTDAKSHHLKLRQTQQVKEQTLALDSLRTAEALELAILKEQQKEQQRATQAIAQAKVGTDSYSVSVRKTAEDLHYYSSRQGQAALRDQERLKGIKQLGAEDQKRSNSLKQLQRDVDYLNSAEGKRTAQLQAEKQNLTTLHQETQKRANSLKQLQRDIDYLNSAEGQRAAQLQSEKQNLTTLHQETQKRSNSLKQLQRDIDYLNSAEGQRAAQLQSEKQNLTTLHQETQKRSNSLKQLQRDIDYLNSAEGQRAAQLQAEKQNLTTLHQETQKRSNALKQLQRDIEYLNSAEGQRSARLQAEKQNLTTLHQETQKRSNALKQLQRDIEYLNSAEGQRSARLQAEKQNLTALHQETQKRSISLKQLKRDIEYLNSAEGQRSARLQAEKSALVSLNQEEEKRSQQMAKMARELERLKNGEEAAKYALEARLRAAREAARAEAELATGTSRASRASKEAVSQLQRHQLELEKLRETSAFYQTAQGKEILQIQRRIQAEKRLQQVMEETHIKNRFLAQSISLLSGRSLIASQATAGLRASLAGLNASFGMYTSSTILFATAMYTMSRALRNAITTGAEFESQMDRVTAVMDSSGGMAKYMTNEVREIARVTVFTANEVAEGLMQLGMAGLNTKDAMLALEPSLRLASIGMLDMGNTADIVTNIMMGMNLEMESLPDVVDDMASAVTNSNMNIQQLGNAMSYVAPLTRDANISVQEIIGTLEVLHNTGIKSSRAGTAMRTSILALLAPTAKAMKVLDEYSITVDDHTGGLRNWTELLGDFAAANLSLADVENLVGKRQAAAFKAMIDSMKVTEGAKEGTDAYGKSLYEQNTRLKESVKRLRENAGAAQVMQAVMEDNLRGDWLKLISAIKDKFLEFYDSNAEGMRGMVQSITQFVNELDVGRIDDFFSSTIYWIEKLAPLLVGLKVAGLAHGITAGFASTLALIPHPAAKAASVVLGSGAVIAGGVAGSMAYNAVSGGIDWTKQQASPEGLDNIERRTGAYRHTSGKSDDELRQMYHSYAKSLEIIKIQKAELDTEFAGNRHLEEYTRKMDSLETAAGNLNTQWKSLNEVMDASAIAPTEALGKRAIQDIDARIAQLDDARQLLETMGKMARQDTYDSSGQFHRSKSFGVVTQQDVLSGLSSSVTARTSLSADLGWASVSNAERETYAKTLRESLQSALINLDPSEVGLDQFMADIKRQIEDSPGAEFIKIEDEAAFLAGLRAYYEMQKGINDNESERNSLLKERYIYQGQLNQGIKGEAELQAMILGKDAEKGIDRVKKTTEEYRKSAAELYRLNDTSEQLAENQKNLLELERNIAAAHKEVVDAEADKARDPDAEVRIAASAMEQAKWTGQALELRTKDLKLRQPLIQAAEKEAEATRNSTRALQEQVNLQSGLIAFRMTMADDYGFDQSHINSQNKLFVEQITHTNSQNKLIEEQKKLREQVNAIKAADVTDEESLKLHYAQLEPLEKRLKLLQDQEELNDKLYHQNVALSAMDSRDDQKAKLKAMQDEVKLQELTADYQQQGYWYTAEERAQRQMAISLHEVYLKQLQEKLATEKTITGTLPETLTARQEEITALEKLIDLLKKKPLYQTAEQVALENTKRIYESLYQGMESATISLLESGLKDTESFFDSLVKSFKRMLAEMAYQAAIKPIVVYAVQTVSNLMPGGSSGAMGLDFLKTQFGGGSAPPVEGAAPAATGAASGAAAGFPWAAAAMAAAGIVAGAISSHNKRDEERMKKFTTAYVKNTHHAGTVLGNIEAQSRSASNSLTHLTDINTDLLSGIFQLTYSLKAASTGMTALARNSMNMLNTDQMATFENTDWEGGTKQGFEFGGIVGGITGAFVGGVLGAFGAFGTKKTLQDAGVFIGEATVGEIAAGLFEANYYQQIKTTKKKLWRKSSSSETVLGDDVGEKMREYIIAVSASLTKPLIEVAKSWDLLGDIDVGATVSGLTEQLANETKALESAKATYADYARQLQFATYGDNSSYSGPSSNEVKKAGEAQVAAQAVVDQTTDYLKKFTGMAEGGYEGLFAEFNTNIGKISQGTGGLSLKEQQAQGDKASSAEGYMSFKEQQEQWDKAFSAEGDKMVAQLRDLSKPLDKLLTSWQVPADDEGEGEGAYEAMTRLYAEGAHFERTMQNIGVAMGITGIAAADLAQRYYEQAGGMDKYNEIVGAYYDRFFTEEERANNHLLQVSDVFNQLSSEAAMAGRELPTTSEAWRQLVTEVTEVDPENAALILQLQQLSVSADVAQEVLRKVSEELSENAAAAAQEMTRRTAEGLHFERTMQNIGVAMRITGVEAADLAQRYYEQAGGLEQYNKIFDAYYERFFTEEERAMNNLLQFSDEFNQLGSSAAMAGRELPQTSEAWRQLVTEVTNADPENAALILQLQQLSVSADVAQEVLRKVAEELREVSEELYKFDDDLKLKNLHDALDMVKRAVDAEKAAQQERYELLDAELSAREDATAETVASLKTLVASLATARESLQVLTMSQRSQQWQAARGAVMSQAATGQLPLDGELDWALNVFSSERGATDFYDNFAQYQYEQAVTSNYLKGMEDAASSQLTTEELMLEQIRLQREQAKRSHESEIARLDAIYEDAKRQVDVLLGIDTGVSSIAAAIYDLRTAMMGYAVTGKDIQWAVGQTIEKHGGINDAAGLELFNLAKEFGVSLERVREFLPEVDQQGMDSWLERMGLSEIKGNDVQWFINEVLKQYGSTSDAANAIATESSKHGIDAGRVEGFLPEPLPPAQPKQATNDDIQWAVGQTISKYGGVNDAAALELYNLAKAHNVSLSSVKPYLPAQDQMGMDSWLARMGLSETAPPASPPASPQVTDGDIQWAVNQVLAQYGGLGDAASLELYNLAKSHNISLSRVKPFLPNVDQAGLESWVSRMGLPMFAQGGYHPGGLRLVGERGPELEATGPARYFSATQTASMLNQPSVAPDVSSAHDDCWVVLASEIRAARGDMNAMKHEIVKELREIKEYDRKSERHLNRVVKDGVQILEDVE